LKLSINDEIIEADFATLGEWAAVEFGKDGTKGFALAVNDCIVPSSKWDFCLLQNGDRILAVKATQGG
jgi:sulfur carrier protein